jgi:hypothetical protein
MSVVVSAVSTVSDRMAAGSGWVSLDTRSALSPNAATPRLLTVPISNTVAATTISTRTAVRPPGDSGGGAAGAGGGGAMVVTMEALSAVQDSR